MEVIEAKIYRSVKWIMVVLAVLMLIASIVMFISEVSQFNIGDFVRI